MSKKTVLITGSGSGLGKATALKLAKQGHRVLATTHYKKEANELNELAIKENLSIDAFVLDINSEEDRNKVHDYQIDVLINNAAIGETGSLAEIKVEKVISNFNTNLFSTLSLTQEVLKQMIKRDTGRIIFISSLLGRSTSPFFGPYSMTKFALSAAAATLKDELKIISSNINICVVEPGAYHTGYNQKMIAKKFEWMKEDSYFYEKINYIKKREKKLFDLLEQKNIDSIIVQIVNATEVSNPKFRYVAPWWQGLGIQVLRILGR